MESFGDGLDEVVLADSRHYGSCVLFGALIIQYLDDKTVTRSGCLLVEFVVKYKYNF